MVGFLFGCRKYDSLPNIKSPNYAQLQQQFFNTNTTNDTVIKKLAADIRRQDSMFHFLPDFITKNGIPRWDKVIYSSNHSNSGNQLSTYGVNAAGSLTKHSQSSTNEGSQGIFFIPLQAQNANTIQSYIVAYKHNDNLYTYRLYNRDSLNAIQPKTVEAKNNLLNTQAMFGYFEKEINNQKVLEVKTPIEGKIRDVAVVFNASKQTNTKSTQSSKGTMVAGGCEMSIEVTISYSFEVTLDGNTVYFTESYSVTLTIIIDCTGGGSCSCATPRDNIIDGVGGNGNTNGNWWDYGTGYPYFPWNPSGISGGSGPYEPDWSWWWTGGGGVGSGGSGFSPTVTALSNQLGLSYPQSLWLESNPLRANEIYNYLQGRTNPLAYSIANEHINKMMSDIDYFKFNQQYYSSSSSNNVWWEDDNWLDNPNNFNLDLDQNQNGQYDRLTAAEKALVKKYPIHAYMISKNKPIAEEETISIFGQNGLNDKSDAFRHAFFNAMNRRDLGLDPMTLENIAKLFSDAHESEVPPQLQKEKDMDLWNNAVGHIVGNVMFPIFISNSSLSSDVLTKLTNGELRYLKPVLSPSLDPNFWGANGVNNPLTATHGITNSTQLTPTNQ